MIQKRYVMIACALLIGSATSGCEKKEDNAPKEEAVAKPADKAAKTADDKTPNPGADEASKPAHSSAIPGTMNQLKVDQAIPEVTLDLTSPKADAVVKPGEPVKVGFDLKHYRTGKTIGQHIHVIVDNEPYIAHYNADKPLMLDDLEPGTHTLRVFPARHYHLSLKKGDVFQTRIFHVGKKSKDFSFDPDKPYLTYSRPKGSYGMDAAKELLLDFYVSNATLGDDAKVVYSVDGKETELTEWKPVLLPALEPGEHTVELKLVDMDGKPIKNGGYNDTTRTITVEQ